MTVFHKLGISIFFFGPKPKNLSSETYCYNSLLNWPYCLKVWYDYSSHPDAAVFTNEHLYQRLAVPTSSRPSRGENLSNSGRWHSLDSISQQQLVGQIKSHQKFFLRKPSMRENRKLEMGDTRWELNLMSVALKVSRRSPKWTWRVEFVELNSAFSLESEQFLGGQINQRYLRWSSEYLQQGSIN